MVSLGSMLRLLVCAAAGNYIHTPTGCYRQGSVFAVASMTETHNWERHWQLLWIPPHRRNSLDRKPLKRVLKHYDGVLKKKLLIVDGFPRRTHVFLRGWPQEDWPCSSEYRGNTNWTCVFFLFSFCGGGDMGGWTWEEWEASLMGYIVWNS